MSDKRCEACRTVLAPKVFECGKVESPAQFQARKFCDRRCARLTVKPMQPSSHPWKVAGDAKAAQLKQARGTA